MPPPPGILQSQFLIWLRERATDNPTTNLDVAGVTAIMQRLDLGSEAHEAAVFRGLFLKFLEERYKLRATLPLRPGTPLPDEVQSSAYGEEPVMTPATSAAGAEDHVQHITEGRAQHVAGKGKGRATGRKSLNGSLTEPKLTVP